MACVALYHPKYVYKTEPPSLIFFIYDTNNKQQINDRQEVKIFAECSKTNTKCVLAPKFISNGIGGRHKLICRKWQNCVF